MLPFEPRARFRLASDGFCSAEIHTPAAPYLSRAGLRWHSHRASSNKCIASSNCILRWHLCFPLRNKDPSRTLSFTHTKPLHKKHAYFTASSQRLSLRIHQPSCRGIPFVTFEFQMKVVGHQFQWFSLLAGRQRRNLQSEKILRGATGQCSSLVDRRNVSNQLGHIGQRNVPFLFVGPLYLLFLWTFVSFLLWTFVVYFLKFFSREGQKYEIFFPESAWVKGSSKITRAKICTSLSLSLPLLSII